MATFTELTDAQKAALKGLLEIYRPLAAEVQGLMSKLRAVQLEGQGADVQAALTALGDDDVIPNETNLANAKEVTKSLVVDHLNAIDFVLDGNVAMGVAGFDSSGKQAERQKFAGINAILKN